MVQWVTNRKLSLLKDTSKDRSSPTFTNAVHLRHHNSSHSKRHKGFEKLSEWQSLAANCREHPTRDLFEKCTRACLCTSFAFASRETHVEGNPWTRAPLPGAPPPPMDEPMATVLSRRPEVSLAMRTVSEKFPSKFSKSSSVLLCQAPHPDPHSLIQWGGNHQILQRTAQRILPQP